MTSRLDMAMPEAFVDCRARQGEATSRRPSSHDYGLSFDIHGCVGRRAAAFVGASPISMTGCLPI
jgi:hypothetical protein